MKQPKPEKPAPLIREACNVFHCKNPAGSDGLCSTCRTLLSSRRRERFATMVRQVGPRGPLRVIRRLIHKYHIRRARN